MLRAGFTGGSKFMVQGGIVTYNGTKTVHTFTSTGTLTVTGQGKIDVLVVAGGGGGGNTGGLWEGGGGGGGGLVYHANRDISAGTYTVTVGTGGTGGNKGTNSVFDTITALGGGNGGVAISGGSGGGGTAASGGAATQGNSGGGTGYGNAGAASGASPNRGGGGGGAGGAGSGSQPPVGGAGRSFDITGTPKYYAAGGGGGSSTAGGAGGSGIGGQGASPYGNGGGAVANTGSGGGGCNGSANVGGRGADGIVIISHTSDVLFTPSQVSNLKLWVDASKIVGLADGQGIASWADQSGNNNHLVQSDSTRQPLYKTNVVNGKPAVRFDGSNDYLKIDSLTLPTYISIFVVSKTNVAGKGFFIEHGPDTNTNDGFFFYGEGTGAFSFRRSGATHTISNSGWFGTNWALGSGVYNGTHYVRKDGNSPITGTISNTARSDSNVTATLYVGERVGDIIPMNGDIAELLIYTGVVSDTDRTSIENYLKRKYGIT